MIAIPEGKYADIGDGLQTHYHEAGTGEPVVFIHGSGPGASGWSNFRGNYRYFAEAGFRALVPDSIGYGLSSKPESAKYTLEFMAGGVMRFLDALSIERCALVGNSLGGAMAIRCALSHPDRISRLILMAPGGLEERETYMKMAGIKAMMRSIFGDDGITKAGMRAVFDLQVYDPSLVGDDIIEQRYRVALTQPKVVFETMRVPNQADALTELKCPVFALWGADDQFCPVSGATTLARSVPDAQVMMLSRCGHWVMVEHADRFNRLCVDFLEHTR